VNKLEPTVFIVDDDPSARRGLTRLIRVAGWQAEAFGSAKEFLASERRGPGCIVLDVQMPGMTGPELQETLCKAEYGLPIIFLSAHGDVPTTAKAMKKGAIDFLTKPVDREDLLAAIRASLAQDAGSRETWAEVASIQERIGTLTPREHEIMTYVITGMLNKQIAAELDISVETVKIHRGRMTAKLGTNSVVELLRLAEAAGVKPRNKP
jgi:FixJ family two-component response regulator